MQLAVIGAGNMGCVYGANLARIGVDVTMIDPWAAHVTAMGQPGLIMTGRNGTFTAQVEATTDGSGVAGVGDNDALTRLMKGRHHTPSAAQDR